MTIENIITSLVFTILIFGITLFLLFEVLFVIPRIIYTTIRYKILIKMKIIKNEREK